MVCMGQGEGAGRAWHARSWLGAVRWGQAWPCSALLLNSLWKPFPVLCSSDQAPFPTAAPMHTPISDAPAPELSLLQPVLSLQCILIPCYASVLSPHGQENPSCCSRRTLMGWLGHSPSPPPSTFGFSSPAVVQRPKMPISTF